MLICFNFRLLGERNLPSSPEHWEGGGGEYRQLTRGVEIKAANVHDGP